MSWVRTVFKFEVTCRQYCRSNAQVRVKGLLRANGGGREKERDKEIEREGFNHRICLLANSTFSFFFIQTYSTPPSGIELS